MFAGSKLSRSKAQRFLRFCPLKFTKFVVLHYAHRPQPFAPPTVTPPECVYQFFNTCSSLLLNIKFTQISTHYHHSNRRNLRHFESRMLIHCSYQRNAEAVRALTVAVLTSSTTDKSRKKSPPGPQDAIISVKLKFNMLIRPFASSRSSVTLATIN